MDDMRLDAASNEPARQPEAVAASFIGQSNPPDRPASTHRLVPPPLDQSQQRRRIRLQLLQRLALTPGTTPLTSQLACATSSHRRPDWIPACASSVPFRPVVYRDDAFGDPV